LPSDDASRGYSCEYIGFRVVPDFVSLLLQPVLSKDYKIFEVNSSVTIKIGVTAILAIYHILFHAMTN
jgi:indole-3-glycerol phosphate synthase